MKSQLKGGDSRFILIEAHDQYVDSVFQFANKEEINDEI